MESFESNNGVEGDTDPDTGSTSKSRKEKRRSKPDYSRLGEKVTETAIEPATSAEPTLPPVVKPPEFRGGAIEELLRQIDGDDKPNTETKSEAVTERESEVSIDSSVTTQTSETSTEQTHDAAASIEPSELSEERTFAEAFIEQQRSEHVEEFRAAVEDHGESPQAAEAATSTSYDQLMLDMLAAGRPATEVPAEAATIMEDRIEKMPTRSVEEVDSNSSEAEPVGSAEPVTYQAPEFGEDATAADFTEQQPVESVLPQPESELPRIEADPPQFAAEASAEGDGNDADSNEYVPDATGNHEDEPLLANVTNRMQMPEYSLPTTMSVPAIEAKPAHQVSASNERAALGQGLLIGGIVGYFVGRNRGRKQAKTEAQKKTQPILKGLENRIQNLQETITGKDRNIRSLARDKANTQPTVKSRENFINDLLAVPSAVAAESQSRPVRSAELQTRQTSANASGEVFSRKVEQPAVNRVTEVLLRNRGAERLVSELGRPAAEALVVAAAAVTAPLAAERAVNSRDAAVRRSENDQARVELKTRRVDAATLPKTELLQAAQKVKVEGSTLRQAVETGRIDEPGLRRVMAEFLSGGDVSRALVRETKELDLRYERDPSLRQASAASNGGSPSARAGAGGLLAKAIFGDNHIYSGDEVNPDGSVKKPSAQNSSSPMPDRATLRALRNRQMTTVGMTALVVIVVIIVVLVVT